MTYEEGIEACRKETRRLRSIVREHSDLIERLKEIDYKNLFELWAEFNGAESAEDASSLVTEKMMGAIDAISFMAFCRGYEQAIEKIREAA